MTTEQTKQRDEEIIYSHKVKIINGISIHTDELQALDSAIKDVENTIEVLNRQKEKGITDWESFADQQQILEELKSRL